MTYSQPHDALTALYPRVAELNKHYLRNETYYAGEIRPEAFSLALPPEVSKLQTVVNWSAVVINAIEERLRVQGFRIGDNTNADERLWDIWESNELDHYSSLGHIEALVQGRAWITVDRNPDDTTRPIVMCESADCMAVDIDPRTRKLTAAVRRWHEYDGTGIRVSLATVYLPNTTTYYVYGDTGWQEWDSTTHNLGTVPVIPLVNESRLPSAHYPLARWGYSELNSTIPLVDAASRALTNLQAAQEFLAVPTRYVLGVSPDEFKDQDGNQVSAWDAYIGRFNALSDPEGTAKVVQLAGADLTNFSNVLNTYAKMISSVSGVPLRVFGVSSDANPASAEAIAADEGRLVMRCLKKTRSFGSSWEAAMRIAAQIADIDLPNSERLETWWADPATPTFAAKAAAISQLYSAGVPLPRSYMYEVLDFSPEQRAAAENETATDPLVKLLGTGNAQSSGNPIPEPNGPNQPPHAGSAVNGAPSNVRPNAFG